MECPYGLYVELFSCQSFRIPAGAEFNLVFVSYSELWDGRAYSRTARYFMCGRKAFEVEVETIRSDGTKEYHQLFGRLNPVHEEYNIVVPYSRVYV